MKTISTWISATNAPSIYKGSILNSGPLSTYTLLEEDADGDSAALALDANYVYFVDHQTIFRTPK